jgi:hypothetical protein
MNGRRYLRFLSLAGFFLVVGCNTLVAGYAQGAEGENRSLSQATEETVSIQNPDNPPTSIGAVPESPPVNSTPGQPGFSPSNPGQSGEPPALPPSSTTAPEDWVVYTDASYPFTLSYPSASPVRQLSQEDLNRFTPVPLYALDFIDPALAGSDLAHMSPPLFSVRIYANPSHLPLEAWLAASGPPVSGNMEPYQGKHIKGIKVVSSTFIAPGMWIYVAHQGAIYQLTPLGQDGEQMLDTFAFLDR